MRLKVLGCKWGCRSMRRILGGDGPHRKSALPNFEMVFCNREKDASIRAKRYCPSLPAEAATSGGNLHRTFEAKRDWAYHCREIMESLAEFSHRMLKSNHIFEF